MGDDVEKGIESFPIVAKIIRWNKSIILPGFEGLSLYDFWEMYIVGIVKGTFSTRASAIAFSFFMALFPFFLFLLNLISVIPAHSFQQSFVEYVLELMPPQTSQFFKPILLDIAANPREGLLSFSLVVTIFLMANGVNAIFSGFEFSYHTHINRSIFKQYAVAFCVSIVLALLLFSFIVIIIYMELTVNEMEADHLLNESNMWISHTLRFIFLIVMIYSLVATLYYFGTKQGKEFRFFSAGAVMTTLLYIVTTFLFGIYINNFSNYNQLYGSIGALLILMVYIWINSNLLLLGFELNATLYQLKNFKNKKLARQLDNNS
ncbi:MAG: ribonuclease BN [Cytophagaceae bacterium]|nr:ribonuclease BN [Cytophagaceae bacterium]